MEENYSKLFKISASKSRNCGKRHYPKLPIIAKSGEKNKVRQIFYKTLFSKVCLFP